MTDIGRPRVYTAPVIQTLVLLFTAGGLAIFDRQAALAALAGGLIAVIPTLYFTWYAFRYRGARSANLIVRAFGRGESGKFIQTLLGFAGVFVFMPQVDVTVLFGVYIAMLLLHAVVTAGALQLYYRKAGR